MKATWKKRLGLILSTLALLSTTAIATAQGGGPDSAARERWQNLPPEQQEALRARVMERLRSLSPAQKKQLRARIEQRLQNLSPAEREARQARWRERWQNMSPAEREQARSLLRPQRRDSFLQE